MRQRSGSDENIGVADESAATMQLCVDFGSLHDNRISERKDLTFPTKILKHRDLLKRPLGFQPAEDLVACEIEKVNRLWVWRYFWASCATRTSRPWMTSESVSVSSKACAIG